MVYLLKSGTLDLFFSSHYIWWIQDLLFGDKTSLKRPLKTVSVYSCLMITCSGEIPQQQTTQHKHRSGTLLTSEALCCILREGHTACFPFILFFFLRHLTLAHPLPACCDLCFLVVLFLFLRSSWQICLWILRPAHIHSCYSRVTICARRVASVTATCALFKDIWVKTASIASLNASY